jgi:hypothetical protein
MEYQLTKLTSWSRVLSEKSLAVQVFKNFLMFYGTRNFITVFTRALHESLFWVRWIQTTPTHPISLRSILILSTQLRLGLPSGLFPSGFPTNILYAFLFAPSVLRALSSSSSLTWSFWLYLEKSTNYEAPHYKVCSNFYIFRQQARRFWIEW